MKKCYLCKTKQLPLFKVLSHLICFNCLELAYKIAKEKHEEWKGKENDTTRLQNTYNG